MGARSIEAEEARQRGHTRGHCFGPETASGHSGHTYRRSVMKTTGLLTSGQKAFGWWSQAGSNR